MGDEIKGREEGMMGMDEWVIGLGGGKEERREGVME